MKLSLTKEEARTLLEILKDRRDSDRDILKDIDAFSHGDWLRFKDGDRVNRRMIKKMMLKKGLFQ